MLNLHNKTARGGFTLIELLVVISIIGLLSSIVLASVNQARKKAQLATVVQQFHQLQTAMELYKLDNGGSPISAFTTENGSSEDADFIAALTGLDKLAPKYIAKIAPSPIRGSKGLRFDYISRDKMFDYFGTYTESVGCGSPQSVSSYALIVTDMNHFYTDSNPVVNDLSNILPTLWLVSSGGNSETAGVWCLGD